MGKDVAIIGGGVAGLEAANQLATLGYNVTVFERNAQPGGHAAKWDRLFPNQRHSHEVIDSLKSHLNGNPAIMLSTAISTISRNGQKFKLDAKGRAFEADAILIATGFELFPAERKEEYGYGIYENVITSAELEEMFAKNGKPTMKSGETPKKIAFIHCVGSRDEKVNKPYCSKVCCVTAVKQAIEVKDSIPNAEVFNLYMDLRMFGPGYEDLYKEAQQKGVTFIRGRLSEASELDEGRLLIKTEDTLSSCPLKMSVDMVVLMVGMSPAIGTSELIAGLGLHPNKDGFVDIADQHLYPTNTTAEGVFVAGACVGPNNITDSVNAARSAAIEIHQYLSKK
ncbi:MAG: CoB--CoM heterodisulfide reductase iron-sulfur subunit A family protein [Bacteroidales bacterium]|nr:CoB--CoM heterodisulfide reductase iron-sulfur subunit A family protein [Bacteroidales bacterium]